MVPGIPFTGEFHLSICCLHFLQTLTTVSCSEWKIKWGKIPKFIVRGNT